MRGTGRPERLWFRQFLKPKPGCGRSLGTVCWPKWQTIRLRKEKQGLAQAVFGRGGELLTQTDDIVGWWKEHFEVLLNQIDTSSVEEAEDLGEGLPRSLGRDH